MKIHRNIYILLNILLTLNIYANEEFDSFFNDMETIEIEDNPLTLKGETEFKVEIPYNTPENLEEPYLRNNFTLEYNSENLNIFSAWDIIIENQDVSIRAQENFLKLNYNYTILKAGFLKYNWGDADKINPTNILNPKDYTDPINVDIIPSLSISLEQYFLTNSIEMVYIPIKNDATFPLVTISENIVLENREKNEMGVLGGKISHYGSIDFSLSYVWDIDDFRSVKEIKQNQIVTYNQRSHNFGISTKTIIDKYGLWLEGNYTNNINTQDVLEGVLGIDRSIGSEDQGIINIQTLYSYVIDFKDETQIDKINNKLLNLYSDQTIGATAKANYSFLNNELTPELTIVYLNHINESSEFIYKGELIYAPIDSLKLIVGGIILTSEDKDDLNKVYTSIEYSW